MGSALPSMQQFHVVEFGEVAVAGPDLVGMVQHISANQAIDKTGEMVNVSTFVNETTNLNFPAAPGAGTSIQRTDWTESGETKTGGNGVGGHSEVSENHAAAWTVATETPGTIP